MTSQAVFDSYRRLRRKKFAASFYRRFLGTSADVARRFEKTNFARQEKLLEHGVLMLLEYASGSSIGQMAMERLAELHDRGHLDIPRDLYPVWVDCLMATAAELDEEWTPALEASWRKDLAFGVRLMVERYDGG